MLKKRSSSSPWNLQSLKILENTVFNDFINFLYFFSRRNESKNFKPVTLPGQEAAADYQVKNVLRQKFVESNNAEINWINLFF